MVVKRRYRTELVLKSSHQKSSPFRVSAPKTLSGELRSSTGLKGLPAERETASKGEGFGARGLELSVGGWWRNNRISVTFTVARS